MKGYELHNRRHLNEVAPTPVASASDLFISQSPDFLAVLREDFLLLLVSKGLSELCGATPRYLKELIGEPDLQRVREHFETLLPGGSVQTSARLIGAQGDTLADLELGRSREGDAFFLTARPRVTAGTSSVDSSEAMYRQLFSANPQPMWVFDVATLQFLAVNEAAVQRYGYTAEEFREMTISDIRPAPDRERLLAAVRDPASELRHAGLWQHRTKEGKILDVEVTSHSIDFLGRRARLVLATDVTETLLAERQLRESNERLNAILQGSPVGIAHLSEKAEILSWNPAAEAILDLKAESVLGKPFRSVIAKPKDAAKAESLLKDGVPIERLETITLRPDGQKVDIVINGSPLRSAAGEISGAIVSIANISDRKKAERELKQLNKDLEKRVANRTAELSSSNKELEAFCFSVSHDLRAPLRSIDGFSKAVMEDYSSLLPDDGLDALRRVRAASQRMAALIDALLGLSRLTRAEMNRERVDLSEIADREASDLQVLDSDRSVEFLIQPGLIATGDPRLLESAIENLLENAYKFTRGREPAVIEFGSTEVNGETVYFVKDNGVGFEMAYISKLFKAFERLHSPAQFEGNGIGLATVQRIVERHGGRVWAEAEEGQWACFYFTLG